MTAATTETLEVPKIPLDQIHHHPLNPRRNAIADEEMVESVAVVGILEPVMVAPAADGNGWVLIDGHRRDNAARRAGLHVVPANPRYDLVTDAQQVEVMAITGLQKELLTPVEEAAAYEQLTLLGFDAAAIAQSTGFSQARVKSRMKLNQLGAKARDSLHDGQMTLDDAQAFLEFAEDPAATRELEEALGTPNFRQQVHVVRGRRERRAARDEQVAQLLAAGARQVETVPGGAGRVVVVGDATRSELAASGMHTFPAGHDTSDPGTHAAAGCLGFHVPDYDYADIHVVCISPHTHTTTAPAPADPPAEDRSDWEKQQADRAVEAARQTAAGRARLDWLVDHFTAMFPTKSHQTLATATKALLPLLIVDGREPVDLPFLARGLGVEPTGEQSTYEAHTHATEQYAKELPSVTATKALGGLAGWFAAAVADQLNYDPAWGAYDDLLQHLALWDWMTTSGYQPSDVDVETRARLEFRLLEVTSDEEPAS